MTKNISFNFKGDFIPELSSMEKNYPASPVITKYCTTPISRIKEFVTETYLAEAIANYFGNIDTLHLFVGTTDEGHTVVEYRKRESDDTQICIASKNAEGLFSFQAGTLDMDGILTEYTEGHKGTMFVMAMLPYILEDSEAEKLAVSFETLDPSNSTYSYAMCAFTNHIYYRLKDDKSTNPIYYHNTIFKLTQNMISDSKISNVVTGTPEIFSLWEKEPPKKRRKRATKSTGVSTSSLRNLFPLDKKRVLNAEEEKRVPSLGEWYVVPEWSTKAAKRIADSHKFRKAIKNILLYGPSGTGKTEGSQAIAQMLGLPYYTYSCSADDDKFDFIGQLIPNTKKGKSGKTTDETCKILGIPTFDDVENDFQGSYEKLFGKKPGKLDTQADAYQEIMSRLLDQKNSEENDFVYVESELIQAIKHGGLCEIQEANIIKRSSVLEALNPLLADSGDGSFIKLPTGEIVRRHPDCIIVFTINRDYEGCNNIQEAVYSRINYIKQIPEPTKEELFNRTKAQTGFSESDLLDKMAHCIVDIHEYCKEKDISGGVCGPRELLDWAQNTILESEDSGEEKISECSVIIAALETILEKVAQNEDDIEDVITGVFKKHFSPAKVDALRK